MFVRTASARDVRAVHDLLQEVRSDVCDASAVFETYTRDELSGWVHEPNTEFLIADDGKRCGGMACAASGSFGKTVTIRQLCVHPAFQSQGLGRSLLEEILGSFPDATCFRVSVGERNEKTAAFYLRNGFSKVVEPNPSEPVDGEMPGVILEMRREQG